VPDAIFRLTRWPGIAVLACVLAACGGGSGGGSPAPPPPPPPPPGTVTISGTITYDFVPHAAVGGLDYAGTVSRPARLVTVHFIEGASTVRATTTTDITGNYSLSVPPNLTGFVRARAESVQTGTPGWDFRVLDNVNGDALYTLDGAALSSGTADSTRNLHADSGWTGSAYGDDRAAAPFAILDTIYAGAQFVLAGGASNLPALKLHWSPDNIDEYDADGNPDPTTGEIGTSFFGVTTTAPVLDGIYLLGAEGIDTEEYDRHVIMHEFGHYLEYALGRSDSIGGPHSRGDRLDPRTAFSEGWATAFAALALGDTVYVDAGGPLQAGAFRFDVEDAGSPNPRPGWYSEESVWELLYDLVDADVDGVDTLSYPFSDLYAVMTGHVVLTTAVTSVFPLLNAMKTDHAGDAATLDLLAADQAIGSITSDYGEGETNDADSADVLPVYEQLLVNDPPVEVCSTDEFTSLQTGAINKLSSRRFLRFTPIVDGGNVRITVEATSTPDNVAADPDWIIHRFGPFGISQAAPDEACQDTANPDWEPGLCVESAIVGPLINAEYVLEVYEWTNTNDDTDDEPNPPIGRTCMNVTVEQL
jgi:hypothetical protein